MNIFDPKPPPTSGAITRSLCSGAMPTKAAMTSRATCGFCVVFQSVRPPVPASYSAVVDEIDPGDVRRRLERGLGGLRIAEMPLIDGVVGGDLVNLRRALGLRL